MITPLMVLHGIISLLLIIMVLLQFGKGAEAGLLSGGGNTDSVFSSGQQGNILSKITIVLSFLFMANSIYLAKLQSNRSSKSLLGNEKPVARPLNFDKQREKTKSKKEKSSKNKQK